MKNDDNHRILIVDDDTAIVKYYVEILHRNYSIQVSSSGVRAVNIIESTGEIDLIILEYKLPDLSGIDVLKKIKESKPFVPVLMVTGYGDEDVAVQSFRYGVRDYIKKPFSYEEILDKIDFCLSLKKIPNGKKRIALFHERKSEMRNGHSVIDPHNNHKIQIALAFIENNYTRNVNLDIVADKACMSKYYFSKKFRIAMGITYQDYVSNLRIEKAKRLLKNDIHTISDVAYAVGYEDITHFGRMFKRRVGQTPSQYKQVISSIPTL